MRIRAFVFHKNLIFFLKKGDSGGPLICGSNTNNKKVYGIVSWGVDCARGVGIYARVAFHRHWINTELKVTGFHIHSI